MKKEIVGYIGIFLLGFGSVSTILASVKLVNPTCDAGHLIPLDAPFRLAIYVFCLIVGLACVIKATRAGWR